MALHKLIRTALTYKDKVSRNEQMEIQENGISLTEQDASISPREIMYRFTSGNLPEVMHPDITPENDQLTFDDYQSYYDQDYDLSDLTRDRIRLLELKQQVEQSLDAKKALRKKEHEKELLEFEQWKKLQKEALEKNLEPKISPA